MPDKKHVINQRFEKKMEFPKKWRDSVDPLSLKFTKFKTTEILGFPHAGNDVFYVKGIYDGKHFL